MNALYEAHQVFQDEQDCRFAGLMCLIANVNRGKNQRPFKVSDFFIPFEKRMKKKNFRPTPAAMALYLKLALGAEKERFTDG
tara:strand:+ start:5612 stop:5857 length:246 start_codon:yes stop_codon:yes gene_type:complete